MQEYPEIQKIAQKELDTTVGHGRLPSFNDRENLPYINALCKEILRYVPSAPRGNFLMRPSTCVCEYKISLVFALGIPHMSTEDDTHDGYFIPKGTYLYANIGYV
jgi:cytochrome P450